MDNFAALSSIGMTDAEQKVYVALLKLGKSTIGPVIKVSGLHSSVVYNSIYRLTEKGVVGYNVEGKTKHFFAMPPSHLIDVMKEKEESILELLPRLEQITNSSKDMKSVFVFEGDKAVRTAFNDMLNTLKKNDEQLVLGASNTGSGMGGFVKRWDEKRIRKGIRKRVLVAGDAEWASYYKKQKLTKVKNLSKLFDINMSINIYGNKTMLVLWGKYPIHIIIDRPEITANFRKYFDVLWNSA